MKTPFRLAGPPPSQSSKRSTIQRGSAVNIGTRQISASADAHAALPVWGLPTLNRNNATHSRATMKTATFSGHANRIRQLLSLWPRTLTRAAPMAATILLAAAVWGAQAQPAVPSLPTIQNGYGTLAVSNSSINVSTLTASPSSAAWLMPLFGNLVVQNAGTGNLYLCFFGGTCTSSNGWKIAAGAALTVSLGGRTVSPTIISDTSSTAIIGW